MINHSFIHNNDDNGLFVPSFFQQQQNGDDDLISQTITTHTHTHCI